MFFINGFECIEVCLISWNEFFILEMIIEKVEKNTNLSRGEHYNSKLKN